MERLELTRALGQTAGRFADLLRFLGPADAQGAISGMEWTVAEVGAHVVTVVRRALGDMRRSASPADTARLNAICLAELEERDPRRLADLLVADVDAVLRDVIPRLPGDLEVPFHGGTTIRLLPAFAIVLGELLVHGDDISRAVGRAWTIDPRDCVLVWKAACDVLPAWLRRGAADEIRETYEVRVHGETEPFVFVFADGRLSIARATGAPADHVIVTNPLELLMTFPYGRRPTADPALARLASMFEPV